MTDILPWQRPLLERSLRLKQSGRLPHAVLLESRTADDLTGFLLRLAQGLLCENLQSGQSCGNCRACSEFSNGVHSDFKLITIEYNEKTKKDNKNINIEQIRNLIHEVYLSRGRGDLRIAVIYPAEKMSLSAANSLLKTLEEPADGTLLLLASHNKGRLPVTIRSRCQHWVVSSPSESQAVTWLGTQGLNEEEARSYLEFAGNDPALAQALKQKDYASSLDQFRSGFSDMLQSRLSASALAARLAKMELAVCRRLLFATTRAYLNQFLSLTEAKNPSASQRNETAAQAVLDLDRQMHRQLAIEENNLDFQLQLEDVLISLKQVILRSRQ